MAGFYEQQTYSKGSTPPDSEIVGSEKPLLYSDVEKAFERTKPAPENPSTNA